MNAFLLAAPSGEAAKAGPWGFAVILLLAVAFYFLFKSMSKHLKKVREQFPDDQPPQGGELAPRGLVKHPPVRPEADEPGAAPRTPGGDE
jgi:hypothetical protein